ncbi:MAG: flagellar export protein FliJ [Hydrogenibacillus sp.]|nr:flagellar export protein FliJ [Hydrogenibacillus sp.]
MFPLERLRTLAEQEQKTREWLLWQADKRVHQAEEALECAVKTRDAVHEQLLMMAREGPSITRLSAAAEHWRRLEAARRVHLSTLAKARAEAEARRAEVMQKQIEVKMFDALKARWEAQARLLTRHREQRFFDEVAVQRHARTRREGADDG